MFFIVSTQLLFTDCLAHVKYISSLVLHWDKMNIWTKGFHTDLILLAHKSKLRSEYSAVWIRYRL